RLGRAPGESPGKGKALRGSSSPAGEAASAQQPPALYVQLHGETARRLEPHEKPLQIQNDYLSQLGFRDLWRVQEEGMDSETGCLIRFYAAVMILRGNRRFRPEELSDGAWEKQLTQAGPGMLIFD
ncbi:PH domain leucine-rich repeat-containing protein phosphatase 1-like, partial [Python bivittatus]|uniref:PH domain leucine-rich repeat-containing protein phosphatase 1-like n=1 Tax=Python bivittatus TaxID=176946 RepID=A0A9F5J8I3_PYTBI